MLASFREVLEAGRRSGAAVGAFTCYTLEVASAVSQAAARSAPSVIFVVSAEALRSEGGSDLLASVREVAAMCAVPACVQLDHVGDRDTIDRALGLGAGAVMADGSLLDFADNVRLVRDAVEAARAVGAGVEGELGHIEGDEERAGAALVGSLTDPSLVPDFVSSTGLNCLAVAVGNAHGRYVGDVSIDWARLAEIARAVTVPLSLHGASGLPERDLARAVKNRIGKVNVNTELREGFLASMARHLPSTTDGARVLELKLAVTEDVRLIVSRKLATLQPSTR
ncbi:MAG: class II fructose-bisphosphate aldolase [Actinobacteria bacterium]|nr:class II fructose-bisphosphate aldolase [Actinomycetota bacterium]